MYKIHFYQNIKGKSPVLEYLTELTSRGDKNSRIKANKIRDYVKLLSIYGTSVGEPYVKHIKGELWELRPLKDRIIFVAWHDNSYVLLHQFVKKTRKIPKNEIEKAMRELKDLKERGKR